MDSSSPRILVFTQPLMLERPLLLFLTHIIRLRLCKVLYIVINFLVIGYICLSSLRVHFKNGLVNFTKGTAQVFIHMMNFLLQGLVARSFLVLLRFFLILFLFVWWCPLPKFSSICNLLSLWFYEFVTLCTFHTFIFELYLFYNVTITLF